MFVDIIEPFSTVTHDSSSSINTFDQSLGNVDSRNSSDIDDVCDMPIPLFSLESNESFEPLQPRDIAILLIELRCRHSLTQSCITHFCELLQLLRVPNAPASFDSIEALILSSYRSTTFATRATVLPIMFPSIRRSNTMLKNIQLPIATRFYPFFNCELLICVRATNTIDTRKKQNRASV